MSPDRLVGVGGAIGDATTINIAAWERDFKINVTSMVLMSRYAIPEMRKQGRGSIVNMSSVSGRRYYLSQVPNAELTNGLPYDSARRKPKLALPDHEGCHHSDDACDGRPPRPREYPSELRRSGNGLHPHDARSRYDRRNEAS